MDVMDEHADEDKQWIEHRKGLGCGSDRDGRRRIINIDVGGDDRHVAGAEHDTKQWRRNRKHICDSDWTL
jgi:hypothetical protein